MPSSPSAPRSDETPRVLVELDTGTWVVERGVEHRRWRLKVDGVWCDADRAPGAIVFHGDDEGSADGREFLVRPPGCQYLCRSRLLLPLGTEIELLVTRPREHVRSRQTDILAWLKQTKPARRTIIQRYRVSRTGRLVRESDWQRLRQRANDRRPA